MMGNTNIYENKIPQKSVQCLSIILINCAFKIDKYYFPLFLEECKYAVKEKKMTNFIWWVWWSLKLDEEVSDKE